MNLPKNEATFTFEEVGDITQQKYGPSQFTVYCVLNMAQKRLLEIEKTRMQSDLTNPTLGLEGNALVTANLKIRVIEAPDWWKQSNHGGTMVDENIPVRLYEMALEEERKWIEKVREQAKPKEKEEGNQKAES